MQRTEPGWRLLYADGRTRDEPEEGGTILDAWPDPIGLCLIDRMGRQIDVDTREGPLFPIALGDGWKPIFYRNRSLAAKTRGTGRPAMALGNGVTVPAGVELMLGAVGPTRTDATVFGRARIGGVKAGPDGEPGEDYEIFLWAAINGRIVDCPREHFLRNVVEHLLEAQQSRVVM